MEKILLSTTDTNEQRLAVISNGIINDFVSFLPGREDRRGSIYRGVIDYVEPSLEACFVDIGDSQRALLRFSEIHESYFANGNNNKPAEQLEPGMPVLVKIVKDTRGEKGALVSTQIQLTTGQLVLFPLSKLAEGQIRVSRRADDASTTRIKEAQEEFGLPEHMSLIVRSYGADKPLSELKWQLNAYLLPFWNKIQEIYNKLESPGLIYEDHNIVNICIREYFSQHTGELICDEQAVADEVRETISLFMPELADRVRCIDNDEVLFDDNVQTQLDSLTARKVQLPSGGELVIDITEALIAIDINSKRARNQSGVERTALKTNLEAAKEIARRLRLCNLSGLVVIDFIDMEEDKHRNEVVTHLRNCLRGDRAKIAMEKLSRFSLLEMTRQNIGRPLHETHSQICTHCDGAGRLPTVTAFARSMLAKIRDICIQRKQVDSVVISLPIHVATYTLNEMRGEISQLQNDLNIEIIILPDASLAIPNFQLRVNKSKNQNNKKSFEFETGQESSFKEYSKNIAKHDISAPALTSFKANQPRPDETESGFFQKLVKLFSTEPESEPTNGAAKSKKKKPKSTAKKRSQKQDGAIRSKGEAQSKKPARKSKKQTKSQHQNKQRKSSKQDQSQNEKNVQKPADQSKPKSKKAPQKKPDLVDEKNKSSSESKQKDVAVPTKSSPQQQNRKVEHKAVSVTKETETSVNKETKDPKDIKDTRQAKDVSASTKPVNIPAPTPSTPKPSQADTKPEVSTTPPSSSLSTSPSPTPEPKPASTPKADTKDTKDTKDSKVDEPESKSMPKPVPVPTPEPKPEEQTTDAVKSTIESKDPSPSPAEIDKLVAKKPKSRDPGNSLRKS